MVMDQGRGRQKAVFAMRPVSSAPSSNANASLSDDITALATPSIHKDEGLIQAPKCGSNAPSASNEGQVFKGGESSAADGEQHTGRAARAEGRREWYRWSPGHHTRRSECYRPTFVDKLCSLQLSVSRRLSLS